MAVAGMEGALASVMGSLVSRPVIMSALRLWDMGEFPWIISTSDHDQFLC